MLSRSTGFDVSSPVSFAGMGPIDAVVEATNIATMSATTAVDFFTASTHHISQAAAEAGIGKHVLLSIVNCDDEGAQAYGYYAGKAAQERAARAMNQAVTIVRTTQWFEFAQQMAQQMKRGPVTVVPKMRTQPVELRAVADVIAQCCIGERTGALYEVCGPEQMWLRDMVKALPETGVVLQFPMPGKAGKAFRDGTLVPEPDCEVIGSTFHEWLGNHSGQPPSA